MPDFFGIHSSLREIINAAIGIGVVLYALRTAYVMRGGALGRVAFFFAIGQLILMGQDIFVSISTYGDVETRRAIASYFISLGLLAMAAGLYTTGKAVSPTRK